MWHFLSKEMIWRITCHELMIVFFYLLMWDNRRLVLHVHSTNRIYWVRSITFSFFFFLFHSTNDFPLSSLFYYSSLFYLFYFSLSSLSILLFILYSFHNHLQHVIYFPIAWKIDSHLIWISTIIQDLIFWSWRWVYYLLYWLIR